MLLVLNFVRVLYDLTGILNFSESAVEMQAKILYSFVSWVIIIRGIKP